MNRKGVKLDLGWQTIPPWEIGYNAFHIQVYSWFPFDAHVDLLYTRTRISLFSYYPQIKVGVTCYGTHAHLDLHAWFGVDLAIFWPRFWERKATKAKRAAELEAFRAKMNATLGSPPPGASQ